MRTAVRVIRNIIRLLLSAVLGILISKRKKEMKIPYKEQHF